MINSVENYGDLFRLLKDLEFLHYNGGMDRFNIHGYQKHGDKTLDVPEDGGCYHLNEMISLLAEVLDKTLMLDYQLKFEREKNKKVDDLL